MGVVVAADRGSYEFTESALRQWWTRRVAHVVLPDTMAGE